MTGYLTQDQIKNLYSESYIFCLPGCYDPKFIDGFGLVFIEAGAQHLPSIAGRIGAVPEIVRENINGILVEPGNIESLSQGLIQILENKKLRNRLAQNAYDQAKQYSWKSCAITTFGYSSFR
jgi:glycosyltransferase involved in cell wall biosynthesis